MANKIIVNPSKVRGLGNIVSKKDVADFEKNYCDVTKSTENINNTSFTVYTLGYTNSLIQVSDVSLDVDTAVLSVKLVSGSTNLSSKTVLLYIGDSTLSATTNSSGVASFSLSSIDPGMYEECLVRFAGDSSYDESISYVDIELYVVTDITLSSIVDSYLIGENVYLSSILTRTSDEGVEDKGITYFANGAEIGSGQTDENGVSEFVCSFDTAGECELISKFESTDYFHSSTSSPVTIHILKLHPRIYFNGSFEHYQGSSGNLQFQCRYGDDIINGQYKVYVDNELYLNLTGATIDIDLSYLNAGEHGLYVVLEGDEVYERIASETVTVTTKNHSLKITNVSGSGLSGTSDYYCINANANYGLSVTVKNDRNSAMKDVNVLFKRDNVELGTATTNASGVASITSLTSPSSGSSTLYAILSDKDEYVGGTFEIGELIVNGTYDCEDYIT